MNLPSVFRFTHLPVTSADDKESPVECLGSCAGGDHPAAPGAPIVAALMSFVKMRGRRSPERTLRRRKPRGCQSNLARSNLDGPSAAIFGAICNAICNAICKKTRAPLHKRFMALGLLLAGGLTSGLSFAQEVTTITRLSLTKSFATSEILAGETQTMTFTIRNPNSRTGDEAVIFGIRFTDDLAAFLPGIDTTTVSLPEDGFCSAPTTLSPSTATLSAAGLLTVAGAELADRDSCTFNVGFIVPAGTDPNDYTNTTSDLDQRTVSNEGNEIGITTPAASATMTIPEPAADLEVTVTDATDPIVAGTNQVYTVTVTNNGPEDAPAVASTFTLPAGTALVSTAGCGEDPGGVPTCALGDIVASGAAEYTVTAAVDYSSSPTTSTITAIATAASTGPNAVADDNAANDAGSASTEVLMSTENTLMLTKSFGTNPIEPGARQTMTFTLSNPDDLTAGETDRFSSISLNDNFSRFLRSVPGIDANDVTLPAAGFCGSSSSLQFITDPDSGELVLGLRDASLNGGESCTMEVEFTVPSDLAPGAYPNTTGVLQAVDDRVGLFNLVSFPAASATMMVVAPPADDADLAVTVTDATDPIVPGANQVYTVAVANNGPGDAPDVISTFTLPAGATLVSTSGCAEDTSGVPTCTLGNIAAASSAGYTVTASINAATTSTITATATAASTGPDAVADNNAANDTGSQDTTVTPSADISITKDDGVTSVNGGGTVTYSIVASNNGPSADPAVAVADTFPPELMNCTYTSVAAGGASGNTASGTGNLAETLSLPSGGEVTYTATCTVAVAATGTLSNTATATASVADPDNSNNSATDGDTVITPVMIDFTKGFSPDAITRGEETEIVFRVDNRANAIDLSAMQFTDPLPAGLVVVDNPGVNNSCGGAFTPAAGATTLAFTGGTLDAGAMCEIRVTVRAVVAGTLTNPGIDLTSSVATVTSNPAMLTVNELLSVTDNMVTVSDADTDIERTASIRPGGMVEPFTELPSTEVFSFPTLSFGLDTSGAFTDDTGSPTGSSSSYRFRAGMVIYDPDDLSGRRLELDIPSVTMTIDNDGAISGEIGPQDFNVWGRTSDTEVAVSVDINTPITFSENTFEFDAATLIELIQSDDGELGDALSNIRTEGQTFKYLLVLKQESANLDEPHVALGSKHDGEFTPFLTVEAEAGAADGFVGNNLGNPPRPLNGLYAGGYRLTGEVRFAVPGDPGDPVDPVDPVPGVITTPSRACNFANTVLSDLNRDIITDAQAIRFLDTLNDSLETAGTAIQAGTEVEMTNVLCILDGIGDIVGALDDSALNPALVNDLQAVTQTTLTLVADLVADDADPDSTEAVMDSTSYVVNAVLGVDATMEADYKATAQSLVESVLSKALDDIAATLGRDRAAFAFTDAEATRVLLAENTTLLDRVLEVTAISLTGTTPLDGDATRSAIEEAGVSAAGAEALAAELNQFVIPPAFLIEIDGQAVDLLDLLNDALPGFGAATVDSGTGTVAFASDSGATEAFVTGVAIVPDSVPQGVFVSPDGSALIIADCVAISLAPSPADPVEFVRAIELVGGGEFITTIRDNGALALTHAPSGDAINITFPFDVIGSGEPGTMTSFTLPQGNDPVDPEYLIGVTFEDGSEQSLVPMIATPQFYDSVTALGLEMETDRSTGVITINGYRFKAGYNSWPATSFEILYWNSSADAFGVAYIPTDANGDGVTDFNVVTLINGVLAGQIVYQLP